MDQTRVVVVGALALSVFAVALVAGPGDEGSASVLVEASSTGSQEGGVPLSGPSVFYTSETYEKVEAAAKKGLAYDVVLDAEVSFTAGDFIQPGRPLLTKNATTETVCTLGFIMGSPGSYHATTAGHCVEGTGTGAHIPLPSSASTLVGIGHVEDFEDEVEVNDWALISIKEAYQDNVFPGVLGSPTPQHGAFSMPGGAVDGGSAGTVWPMPVMMVSNNPGFFYDHKHGLGLPPLVTGAPAPLMGLFVEEHDGVYLCECPVKSGDSGGPVVLFDPGHPEGAALGLVSNWADRTSEFVWKLPSKPLKIYPILREAVFDGSTETLDEMLRGDRGEHEIAAIMPMPTVVEKTGLPVATVDPLSLDPPVGEPCVVKEAVDGGNPVMCYSHLFVEW